MPMDVMGKSGISDGAPVCEVSVSTDPPDWDAYLAGNPSAGLFHDVRWGALMREVYENRCWYLSARRGGKVAGVLQLVEKRSILFGHYLCSVPYFDVSGVLADDADAREALVGHARRLREELGAGWVELRHEAPLEAALPVRDDKLTVRLRLPEDPDVLWDRLKSKVRNHIRKAKKEGVSVERGGAELLEAFHDIYVRTMRDLGSPPHSLRFFKGIVERFGDAVRVSVARLGETTLAASLTLRDRHVVTVPWSGSERRFRDLCGNVLLYWEMLADACRLKAKVFDFGRCTRGSGTHRFKLQWGGEEVPLHWYYLLPEREELPELRHDNPKYRFVEACWQKLPLWAVRVLGPRIIRKLS